MDFQIHCHKAIFKRTLIDKSRSSMNNNSDKECCILDELWKNHGYYVHRRYKYCQNLMDWAIEESENTLNKNRIQVSPSLSNP